MPDPRHADPQIVTPNIAAVLATIAHSEGCDRPPAPTDSYATCFAYKHVIQDYTYHPHELRPDGTREWKGETLTDAQCLALGLHSGCISSAAGRYQITLPTFVRLRAILKTTGFGPQVQDDMAVQLIKEQGALDLVMGGQVTDALAKCASIWASLPGSKSGQPQAEIADLIRTYMDHGGALA
jgi:muramidase (phage lysozyme)